MTDSREWTLEGHGGRLVARTWAGGADPSHVVLLAHGYGEHIGRYERVADALVRNGAVVYAVDHVGHGRSEGDRVLVHRAAGGVGFFAVQIAVALGAHVIGTASPRNHGFLKDAGVAEVLDYSAGPISAQLSEPVDAVLDLVGGDTLADAPRQVKDPSRIVSIVDPVVNEMGGRYVFVRPDQHDLEELGRMADAGQLRVPIAKAFPLEQIADAHRLVAEGHVRGKVVVTLR